MIKKLIAAVVMLALVLAGCSSVSTTTTPPTLPNGTISQNGTSPPTGFSVSDLASDFELLNLEGETVYLSGLRGSPVMINFWTTT
jgi:PBP1b-binding outer membrane lipoprotein LpoB